MSSRASTVRMRVVEPSVVVAVVEPVVVPASGTADGGMLGEAGVVAAGLEAAGGVGAVSGEAVCAMAGASIAINVAAGRIKALVISSPGYVFRQFCRRHVPTELQFGLVSGASGGL